MSHSCRRGISLLLPIFFAFLTPVSAQTRTLCGSIRTFDGDTVLLRDKEHLALSEFQKLAVMRLQDAAVYPEQGDSCVLKLCGFTSLSLNPGNGTCLGSDVNLMDCEFMDAPDELLDKKYNELFNASSISCGCDLGLKPDCGMNCSAKRLSGSIRWREGDCAILYQGHNCNDCFLSAIRLQDGEELVTNHSLHVTSILVREQCTVSQSAPSIRKICGLENALETFSYDESHPDGCTVASAFQAEPEAFTCTCREPPSSTEAEASPPEADSDTDTLTIALGVVAGVALFVSIFSLIACSIYRRRAKLNEDKLGMNLVLASTVFGCGDDDNIPITHQDLINDAFNPAIEICRDDFLTGHLLGSGNFGQVSAGTLKVAIKTVKRGDPGQEEMAWRSLQHEIKILSCLGSHQNVVRFLGACDEKGEEGRGPIENGHIYLLTEYCSHGSLKDHLKKVVKPQVMAQMREKLVSKLSPLPDGYSYSEAIDFGVQIDDPEIAPTLEPELLHQFLKWSEEIASGMDYITSRKVIHVDLAARNVLLTTNLVAKIGDFGLSRKIYINDYISSKREQDPLPLLWLAPEALTRNEYSPKSDVWSYGVTLWEMWELGKDPYPGLNSMEEILSAIIQGRGLPRPEYAPEDIYSKLVECWRENPTERPSFQELRKYFSLQRNRPAASDDDDGYSQTHC